MPRDAEIRIRAATAADAPALSELWIEFGRALGQRMPGIFREPTGEGMTEWFEKLIAETDERTLRAVVEEDGRVIALANAVMRPPIEPAGVVLMPEQHHPRAMVEDIVVAEHARNRGIGEKLMRFIEEWARTNGAVSLQLSSDPDGPTRRFYERFGMHIAAALYTKPLR